MKNTYLMYVNFHEATNFEINVQHIIMYAIFLFLNAEVTISYYPRFLTKATIYKNISVSMSTICTG